MTPRPNVRRTVARVALAAAAAGALALPAAPAAACQPEYCPPPPLRCTWGPFAGTCLDPY